MKHQSSCPFVKLNKQDEKEWTMHEMYELYKKYQIKKYVSLLTCELYVNFHYQSICFIFI